MDELEERSEDSGVPVIDRRDVKWLVDYDYIWLSLEAEMRGGKLVTNSKTGNFDIKIPQGAKPFMNDRGIKDVMAILRASVNHNTATGNIQTDRVMAWCKRMQEDLCDLLYVKQDEYELDSEKFLLVVSLFMNAYEINLTKSIGGKTRDLILSTERRVESYNESEPVRHSTDILGRIIPR